ncbi:MAG: hypothetical protein KA319_05555 [Ferruginibacter sp.]|nr:hypothetical protein [Ferruginibacter sp.]
MNSDLITNDFTENIDIRKIDKSILLSKIVLLLNSLYYLIELFVWLKYLIVNNPNDNAKNYNHNQLIFGLIFIPLAITFYISWFWFIKGNKSFKHSIQNNDYKSFDKGYDLINKSTIASIIGSFVNLIDSSIVNI